MTNDPAAGQDVAGNATSKIEQSPPKSKRGRLTLSQISTSLDKADQTVDEVNEVGWKVIKLAFKVVAVAAAFWAVMYVLLHHGLGALQILRAGGVR